MFKKPPLITDNTAVLTLVFACTVFKKPPLITVNTAVLTLVFACKIFKNPGPVTDNSAVLMLVFDCTVFKKPPPVTDIVAVLIETFACTVFEITLLRTFKLLAIKTLPMTLSVLPKNVAPVTFACPDATILKVVFVKYAVPPTPKLLSIVALDPVPVTCNVL